MKRSAITENKQKDLTKSSSTLLVDEEAPSLLFFIFLSPLSLKSLFAGERFGMVQQHQQRYGCFCRTVKDWNALPSEIVNIKSADRFKKVLFEYFSQ